MSSSNHETASSTLTVTDETAASCLMLLSRVGESERAFECKTCRKRFASFQALGGHRASHKKPKLDQEQSAQLKPRSHKCSICGAEFALGQALGGHMRRHRESTAAKSASSETKPLLMMSGSKRVCLELDLNLTPRENELLVESELMLKLGTREFETKMELGRFQEYDLRVQIGKRRRFGDVFFDLVA